MPSGDDALFLAGEDWDLLPPDHPRRIVVNLVQGVRHADPALPLFQSLSRKAIRICVSQAVADAVHADRVVVEGLDRLSEGSPVEIIAKPDTQAAQAQAPNRAS